jgi:chromosome partitioning protein
MKSLAVVNLKGGSGKTTTTLSVAVELARRGRRVLVIDADAQANATMTLLDGEAPDAPTLGHVLLGQGGVDDAIRETRIAHLDLLPADAQLADAALLLADQIGREHRLRAALKPIAPDYDHILVDCAPSMSLVTVNVLATVEALLVPVDAGLYSLAGLGRLQEVADQVRQYLGNEGLRIAGLVLTRTHRNKATADIEAQLRELFGALVCRATVPHSVRVEEAHARNRSVIEFSPRSAPATAYQSLVTELFHGQSDQGRADDRLGPDEADDDHADAA